jgi:putative DNA primase/helicase
MAKSRSKAKGQAESGTFALVQYSANEHSSELTAQMSALPREKTIYELSRPCYRVTDEDTTTAGGKRRAGVWRHSIKEDKNGSSPVDEWICGPLHVDAITHNEYQDSNYGLLLRFLNLDSQWITWVLPCELLAGKPEAIISVLRNKGLRISLHAHPLVISYIAMQEPSARRIAATTTGWYGPELFVTPTGNIGNTDAIYQSENAMDGDYGQAGTLSAWCKGIAAILPGNPLLQLGIGTALAAPLLAPLMLTGGGFHLQGDSSNGKTTIVYCASSVWGHGSNFTLKWNATANGLEGIAALRNDCMLALDELGQADGSYVGDVVYGVADGIGKQRAGRTSTATKVRRWRVMLLSSGEITLESKMAENGKRIRAGQEVRLITVPANRTHGAWDDIHGFENGANLSDSLRRISTSDYGHAGPAFVLKLIQSKILQTLPVKIECIRSKFPAEPGQSTRVAERFALVALALELAVDFGLLPMIGGDATNSMIDLFKDWQRGRSKGPSEDSQILKAIRDFIDRHGGSRFEPIKTGGAHVRDRVGYHEETAAGITYLFTRSGLEEATHGFELERVIRALRSANALFKHDKGRAQITKRVPDKSKLKLYWINPAHLESED